MINLTNEKKLLRQIPLSEWELYLNKLVVHLVDQQNTLHTYATLQTQTCNLRTS